VPVAGGPPDVREYHGDMFAQINFGNVIGTSTVAYRFDRFPGQRFQPEFRSAGEDYLFWMGLAHAGARFAFSTRVEATYGRGVNVYSGALWGTREHLQRIHDEARYRAYVAAHYPLTPDQTQRIAAIRQQLHREFAGSLLSLVLHARTPPWAVLRQYYGGAPSAMWQLPRALWGKVRGAA